MFYILEKSVEYGSQVIKPNVVFKRVNEGNKQKVYLQEYDLKSQSVKKDGLYLSILFHEFLYAVEKDALIKTEDLELVKSKLLN